MPFDVFHEAIEKALGRSVWTHEFGLNWEGLQQEFLGEQEPPTIQEIIELISEDKRRQDVLCPDCNGLGKYQGFTVIENCRTCGGSGKA